MATTTQLRNAKDLSREPPRSPRVRLGGYVLMARMIDKGRATINGTNGEYHFNCPVDNMLFGFKGVTGDEVRPVLASGASDEEILAWFNSHGTPKTDAEVKAWSAGTEASSPYDDPEKREWFAGECKRLGLDPARTTLFTYLETDDRQNFKLKPVPSEQPIQKKRQNADPVRQRLRLSGGPELSFIIAGDASKPAVLLLHGSPQSARMFRDVIPELSQAAYVLAPDLPGFGESDVLPSPSFLAFGEAILELLDRLEIGPRYIYLHDYGAPVGLHIAMHAPERVLGLIIQNGNAHRTGLGPQWDETQAPYWSDPNPKNETAATAHLTFEGTRSTYTAGAPADVVARMSPEIWEEDWRVMNLPGRMDTQKALVRDYGKYVERFDAIADYLARRQPPALMIWGRHDPFFELDEVLSWMKALPRMEAHILDAGHKLLETHAAAAVPLMLDFIKRVTPSK